MKKGMSGQQHRLSHLKFDIWNERVTLMKKGLRPASITSSESLRVFDLLATPDEEGIEV